MKTGISQISAERAIQLAKWSPEHDNEHYRGQLVFAAIALLRNTHHSWGLTERTRKEGGRVRQLIVAGALIAAEIDRLNRFRVGKD